MKSMCGDTRATDSIIKSSQKDTEENIKVKDNLASLVTHSMARFIIWIVEDSGELTKPG